jgi:hypothetical protein
MINKFIKYKSKIINIYRSDQKEYKHFEDQLNIK